MNARRASRLLRISMASSRISISFKCLTRTGNASVSGTGVHNRLSAKAAQIRKMAGAVHKPANVRSAWPPRHCASARQPSAKTNKSSFAILMGAIGRLTDTATRQATTRRTLQPSPGVCTAVAELISSCPASLRCGQAAATEHSFEFQLPSHTGRTSLQNCQLQSPAPPSHPETPA